jgi:hypothetical protein
VGTAGTAGTEGAEVLLANSGEGVVQIPTVALGIGIGFLVAGRRWLAG